MARTPLSTVNRFTNTTPLHGLHFYRPQTKFAKVMFLQVSVCPRGGVPAPEGCSTLGRGECLVPGECLLPEGVPAPRGCLVPGGLVWGGWVPAPGGSGLRGVPDGDSPMSPTPIPPDDHCCGRYASYWNAFLFLL